MESKKILLIGFLIFVIVISSGCVSIDKDKEPQILNLTVANIDLTSLPSQPNFKNISNIFYENTPIYVCCIVNQGGSSLYVEIENLQNHSILKSMNIKDLNKTFNCINLSNLIGGDYKVMVILSKGEKSNDTKEISFKILKIQKQNQSQQSQNSEKSCNSDSDCACGVHIKTGACFYGNKNFVDTSKQCPDFCTGIGGNLEIKCVEGECKQVNINKIGAKFDPLTHNKTANNLTNSNTTHNNTVDNKTYPNDTLNNNTIINPIIKNIDAKEAYKLIQENLNNDDFVIIDIRTPSEFNSGHIKGAMNIDYYNSYFSENLNALDKNKTYLVYCRSGHRSGNSMQNFRQLKFKLTYNMLGGINSWKSEGFPVE